MACTAQTEPVVFVKFVDGSGRFSIEYPSDWDLQLSEISRWTELAQEEAQFDFSDLFVAFLAITPDFNSNAIVIAQNFSSDYTLEQVFDDSVQLLERQYSTLSITRQHPVLIGENRAILMESDVSEIGEEKARFITLTAKNPGQEIAWNVTCGFTLPDLDGSAETCDFVIRSFRLLR